MDGDINASYQNGFYDALDGQLFDDANDFNKESYAAGFAAGVEHLGKEDYLSSSAMRDLIFDTPHSSNVSSFLNWLSRIY